MVASPGSLPVTQTHSVLRSAVFPFAVCFPRTHTHSMAYTVRHTEGPAVPVSPSPPEANATPRQHAHSDSQWLQRQAYQAPHSNAAVSPVAFVHPRQPRLDAHSGSQRLQRQAYQAPHSPAAVTLVALVHSALPPPARQCCSLRRLPPVQRCSLWCDTPHAAEGWLSPALQASPSVHRSSRCSTVRADTHLHVGVCCMHGLASSTLLARLPSVTGSRRLPQLPLLKGGPRSPVYDRLVLK